MFAKGDLVYVPQSATLYGIGLTSRIVNEKPSLALFVNYEVNGWSVVVLDGKQWLIKNKEIYSNKGDK